MAAKLYLSLLVMAGVAGANPGLLSGFGRELQREIVAVKKPIEETVVYIGSKECSNVKKILGVAYEQVEGDKEPDVSQLKLEFRTVNARSIYNISVGEEIASSGDFKPKDKTVIYLHGFTDDPTKDSFQNIASAFINKGGYNVLALDGSALIHWLYLRSSTYVQFMGERLGAALAAMLKKGVNPDDIHVVGHSLGSHIAGFTGKTFEKLTGHKIGRISSLDPAGPCFSHVDPQFRLKKTDAKYVDVTHTDAGVFGLWDAVGHTDYYVNGGAAQPNCLFETCSHSRAWVLYSESVLNEHAFPAKKCKDWKTFKQNACGDTEISYLGFLSKPDTTGTFYLRTGEDSPYGLGDQGLVFDGEKSIVNKASNAGGSLVKNLGNVTGKSYF